jgi:WXG100 family type VII secretion target
MPDPTGAQIAVPAELAESGPAIMTMASNLGDQLSMLARQLAPLQEEWVGQANTTWQDLQLRWNSAADSLMAAPGALGTISRAVNTNWVNYSDCEAANVATWQH